MTPRKEKAPPQPKIHNIKAPHIAKANPLAPSSIGRRILSKRGPPPPSSEDAPSSPEDGEEEEEIPPTAVSLTQFQRLEASIDERFEHLDAVFQSFYHDLNATIDDKFEQLLQHFNPQLSRYSRLS